MPTLSAKLSPPLLTGDSGEDAIELLCTAIVAEDVISASYQFTWIKDDTPIDILSNKRIMVCITFLYVANFFKFVLVTSVAFVHILSIL